MAMTRDQWDGFNPECKGHLSLENCPVCGKQRPHDPMQQLAFPAPSELRGCLGAADDGPSGK